MDRITPQTWTLADGGGRGEGAVSLKNEGDTKYPNFRGRARDGKGEPATRQQALDRPGRLSDGPSAHRSAVADTDWHKVGKLRFSPRKSPGGSTRWRTRRLQPR